MILLDSLYINVSGGKVLLDYLVENIEESKISCFYLFDERCKDDYDFIPIERKIFLEPSIIKRHQFYKKNKIKFNKVLCFGNLPPSMKLNAHVITYFHQPLYLNVPKSASIFNKFKIKLKTIILSTIIKNTDLWLVQSENIKERLASKYSIEKENIMLMPFYPPLKNHKRNCKRNSNGYIYISNGGIHKNHSNLIEAFCSYFDDYKRGVLNLTISDKFAEIFNTINAKKDLGYPIVNHGFINRNDLIEIYQSNQYLIFPSLTESFGLGLVEAIENGCKVIGADLPYTYAVCKPSIAFDPLDTEDIKRALIASNSPNISKTEQLVFNQIDNLIDLLKP